MNNNNQNAPKEVDNHAQNDVVANLESKYEGIISALHQSLSSMEDNVKQLQSQVSNNRK